jgi:hypothetical protein
VLCAAVLQHVPEAYLLDALFRLKSITTDGGVMCLSVPSAYPKIDPTTHRDSSGRLFLLRPAEQYVFLLTRLGLTLVEREEHDDALGRSGVRWTVLLFRKEPAGALKPMETLESVLRHDRKVNTYKFALLRALAYLATHRYNIARWRQDGEVTVPLDAIARKWLEYYWPIVAEEHGSARIVQGQLSVREGVHRQDMSFRRDLRELAENWRQAGGLSGFLQAWESGALSQGQKKLVASALANIRNAVTQPVRHAGNARTTRELFANQKGAVLIPGHLWTELAYVGRWVEDSVVLRWAEFTTQLKHQDPSVTTSEVITRLLETPVPDRDVTVAREIFGTVQARSGAIECVWTGQTLGDFEVDHAIPFSLWRNNDLWNLLPASPKANSQKADALPRRDRIEARRSSIVASWEMLFEAASSRFLQHATGLVGTELSDFGRSEQDRLFSAFKDAIEYTAVNRVAARW